MRILYVSLSYIPSRRANSVHVMKMCHALAEQGHEVTLVSKANRKPNPFQNVDDFEFYNVAPNFKIRKLMRPAVPGGDWVYAWNIRQLLLDSEGRIDLVYARQLFGGWLALRLGKPLIFEEHGVPRTPLNRLLFKSIIQSRHLKRLVLITEALREELAQPDLLPTADKVLIAPNGADLVELQPTGSFAKAERRDAVRPFRVGYIGNLFPGKGMEIILPLANRMRDLEFHIVGGMEDDLNRWRRTNPPPNVIFYGFVPPSRLVDCYEQFDIFLLPAQREMYGTNGKQDFGRWTSPIKMFEYMAANKPIVGSDLPMLREILKHEQNALLVRHDDLTGWENAIQRLRGDEMLGRKLAEQARRDVQKYTWRARAQHVLDGIS